MSRPSASVPNQCSVLGARRFQLVAEVHAHGIMRGDPGRKDRAGEDHADERETHHEQAIASREVGKPRDPARRCQGDGRERAHDSLNRGSTTK